jgi:pilus assembly protein CpaB
MLRRVVAAVLVLVAAALALRPQPGLTTVLVAAHDLAPGSTLVAADVRAQQVPAELVPAGAITDVSGVDGRVLAGAARQGEPITDVRLLGAQLARLLAPDPESATVPLRLSDPEVAGLLAPGSAVDVVGVSEHEHEPTVLAERAMVLAVVEDAAAASVGRGLAANQRGRLVVVTLPRRAATQVAAASLSQSITVPLR